MQLGLHLFFNDLLLKFLQISFADTVYYFKLWILKFMNSISPYRKLNQSNPDKRADLYKF